LEAAGALSWAILARSFSLGSQKGCSLQIATDDECQPLFSSLEFCSLRLSTPSGLHKS
jgi:hypothetical protein